MAYDKATRTDGKGSWGTREDRKQAARKLRRVEDVVEVEPDNLLLLPANTYQPAGSDERCVICGATTSPCLCQDEDDWPDD